MIGSPTNLGFAKANNKAIGMTDSEYVLLLNPDTLIGEDVIRESLVFMDAHPKSGAVGVRMLKSDGSDAMESRRGIPTPLTAFFKFSGLCRSFPKNRHFGKYYMGWLPWDSPAQVEVISGAYCMLRRKTLAEVGLLDESFFMYGEDIDLCYRIKKAGWEVWYLPLKILHYKGESTQKSSFRYVHVFYEAMLIFFRKHYSHLSLLFSIPVQLAIYMKAMMALCSMVLGYCRKSLGFVSQRHTEEPLFVFHGNASILADGQQLTKEYGLNASFIEDDGRVPTLSNYVNKNENRIVYQVVSMSQFTVKDILEAMSAQAPQGCRLAVYHPEKQMLITDQSILRIRR